MITAFSNKFERELDAIQLLSLLGHDVEKDKVLKNITNEHRYFIHEDIKCPSCGVAKAHIVSGSYSEKSKCYTKQPHFRFYSSDNIDNHHPLCEFSDHIRHSHTQKDIVKAEFSKPKTLITRYIASLVCQAIENSLITQTDIRNMRQWFFDIRKNNIVPIKINFEQYNIFEKYIVIRNVTENNPRKFKPEYAELPGFNWKIAAYHRIIAKEKEFFNTITPRKLLRNVEKKHFSVSKIFDVRVIMREYILTTKLRNLIFNNGYINGYKFKGGLRDELFLNAYCSLLLFVSSWDFNTAVILHVKIINLPPPINPNLGNIIGINPFDNFDISQFILDANDAYDFLSKNSDYDQKLNSEINTLKNEHKVWKHSLFKR